MEIFTTSLFRSRFKKLSPEIKEKAKEREDIFRNNPFNPKLDTHKLHGKYRRYWAFSITNIYRIMFEFLGNNNVVFIDVDTHNIYK